MSRIRAASVYRQMSSRRRTLLLSAASLAAALFLVAPATSMAASAPSKLLRVVGRNDASIADFPWQVALTTSP